MKEEREKPKTENERTKTQRRSARLWRSVKCLVPGSLSCLGAWSSVMSSDHGAGGSGSGSGSGSGQDGVDENDRQQFVKMQREMLVETNKLRKLETQQRDSEREKKRSQLTLQELASLPEDVNTYRTIGRTFVLTAKQDMTKELEQSVTDNEEFLKTSKDKKVYLEKQVKEAEDNIRELLRGAPALAKQIAGVTG